MLFASGGEWRGRLLSQASESPSDILHSFKIFNHEVKEPGQVQRTLAKVCSGISFLEKNKRNNTLNANEFPTPAAHHVEFRDPSHHCHHWTMTLGSQTMIQTDARFRVTGQSPGVQMWQLLSDDWAVLCHVAFPADWDLRSSEQWPRFIFYVIYFTNNILVYFSLISVCFALLTTMRVLNNASSGSLHWGPVHLLNAVNYIFKCLIFFKKTNILFFFRFL